jgi:glycosyltransferase involved in cell wall biosynthesis
MLGPSMVTSVSADVPEKLEGHSGGSSVSVVIPTFNRSHLLNRAIASVLNQTHRAAEIIVVDDDSSDDTSVKIAEYAGSIPLVYTRLERNQGGGVARNVGIQKASCQYIAFLDSDDAWDPDHLRSLLKAAATQAGHFVVASSALKVGWRNRVLPGRKYPQDRSVAEKLHFVTTAELAFQTSTLMMPKRTALEFSFDPHLRRYQDWDLVFRLIENKVAMNLLPEATTIYYPAKVGNISSTRSNLPSLRFIAKHKSVMSRKTMARFVALQIMRRRGSGGRLVRYLLLALLLRGISLKEAAFYLRELWFGDQLNGAGISRNSVK